MSQNLLQTEIIFVVVVVAVVVVVVVVVCMRACVHTCMRARMCLLFLLGCWWKVHRKQNI